MSAVSRSEERAAVIERLREAGVSDGDVSELADEAEDLVEAGREPAEAAEAVLRRRAVNRKCREGSYRL